MLVCLCVEFCVRKKSTQHSSIDLMPSFVTLPIEDGAIVHMMEAEDLESIFFYSENLARSLTMVDIVQSMMQKINFEVMSGGLKWEILIEHPNNNSFISLEAARSKTVLGGNSNSQDDLDKRNKEANIDGFLSDL